MVMFTCPVVRQLHAIQLTDPGFVKRIRGTAFTTRVSPTTANRVVDAVRGLCNKFIPDVYVYTDHYKGKEAGMYVVSAVLVCLVAIANAMFRGCRSPGWGVSLVASTTTGCLMSAERAAAKGELPEDVGANVAELLLEEVAHGGCVDTSHQVRICLPQPTPPTPATHPIHTRPRIFIFGALGPHVDFHSAGDYDSMSAPQTDYAGFQCCRPRHGRWLFHPSNNPRPLHFPSRCTPSPSVASVGSHWLVCNCHPGDDAAFHGAVPRGCVKDKGREPLQLHVRCGCRRRGWLRIPSQSGEWVTALCSCVTCGTFTESRSRSLRTRQRRPWSLRAWALVSPTCPRKLHREQADGHEKKLNFAEIRTVHPYNCCLRLAMQVSQITFVEPHQRLVANRLNKRV